MGRNRSPGRHERHRNEAVGDAPAQRPNSEPRLREAQDDSGGDGLPSRELWFEDALENLGEVPGIRSSWLVDREDNLTLLDEEVVEALGDETVRAVLREVMGLPQRERKIVLGIVRQFVEMSH